MTNEELLVKIREEIERLYKSKPYSEDHWNLGYDRACEDMMEFLIDLEEAARKYQEGVPVDTRIHYCGADEDVYFANRLVDAVSFGAKWQKEQNDKDLSEKIAAAYQLGLADKEKQMMSRAVGGVVTNADGVFGYDVAAFRFDDNHTYSILLPHEEKRKYGDKVKVIIVKED